VCCSTKCAVLVCRVPRAVVVCTACFSLVQTRIDPFFVKTRKISQSPINHNH
jgi:hypothetical protein